MDIDIDLAALARVRGLCSSGAARSIRLAAKISLGEVARSVGVTPATVLKWERGQRSPRPEAAMRYLAVLQELMQR